MISLNTWGKLESLSDVELYDLQRAALQAVKLKADGFGCHNLKMLGLDITQDFQNWFDQVTLRSAGFEVEEVILVCKARQGLYLLSGYSAKELRSAGVPLLDLIKAGFPRQELLAIGPTAADTE